MYILIDIGNSTVVCAIADKEGKIQHTWRFKTLKEETSSYFRTEMLAGFNKCHITTTEISSIIISSVVPEVNDDISQAIVDITSKMPHFFSVDDALKMIKIDVESPGQLGKDRLADAIAASQIYGVPAIVIDMGTATTIGVVNENHCFVGGMIIPGVKTSLRALSRKASQLPCINIEKPRNFIGRNTLECMQSGILNGTAAMIDGIIDKVQATLSSPAHIVATGGNAKIIIPSCDHDIKVDDFLQFKGLICAAMLQEK